MNNYAIPEKLIALLQLPVIRPITTLLTNKTNDKILHNTTPPSFLPQPPTSIISNSLITNPVKNSPSRTHPNRAEHGHLALIPQALSEIRTPHPTSPDQRPMIRGRSDMTRPSLAIPTCCAAARTAVLRGSSERVCHSGRWCRYASML